MKNVATILLTLTAAMAVAAELTPDAETLVYLARFEKGYALWSTEHRSGDVELVAKLGAEDVGGFILTDDGSDAIVLADRKLMKVNVDSGKPEPIAVNANMEIDSTAERAYLFEHIWRQTREKFYDPDLHGVDWDFLKAEYARFLPHATTDRGFAELMSELQGELNASHTGCRYRPRRPDADATASLGFLPDPAYDGDGVRIAELVEGGPLGRAGVETPG